MSTDQITITIGNTSFNLKSDNKEKLLDITNRLQKDIEKIKTNYKVTYFKSLVINAIYLIEKLDSLNNDLEDLKKDFINNFEQEKEKTDRSSSHLIKSIQEITKMLDEA